MSSTENLQQCYNRGCCQKFDPATNSEDACRHHPGAPFFHDAYKGWSCCNKKCTDFTEFLNIQGCTLAKHSNIKPPEPEKTKAQEAPGNEVVEVKPIVVPLLERPPLDSPLTLMVPEIAPSLTDQIDTIEEPQRKSDIDTEEVAVGTSCKNNGCTYAYKDSSCNKNVCLYHYGVPIFHEGLKYWSCCQRKTTDFNDFLKQKGCREGKHVWRKDEGSDNVVQCRWDYHQTGPYMVVSIYAKQYSPIRSEIKLNPIRLYVNLIFPKKNNANFELDAELKGVIDVSKSEVTMYATKVEIKLKKAEPGSWPKLEARLLKSQDSSKKETLPENLTTKIETVDLSDL